jgi:hypothetical protein
MTFLNWFMLLGLAGVAIPIIIHLLNRSRSRVVDWGAMRFLEASLASRSRRILIEEVLLLVLRCLLIAMATFALARPFLPTRPTAMVVLFIPAVVAGAVCAALAGAMWSNRRRRRWLLAGTVVLLAVPVIAGGLEQAYQHAKWSFGGGEKDVAIVVDGSMSMSLSHEGATNFSRAIAEARAVVGACGPADGVSLVLAGASPRVVLGSPTSNRKDIAAALDSLAPVGGSMHVAAALQAASQSLMDGGNPAKKIVLITDGQQVGWDVRAETRWKLLGSDLHRHPTPPQTIVRMLPMPDRFTNATVVDVACDRRIIGTDRDVRVNVKIAATGTEPVRQRIVRLLVDGEPAGSRDIPEILPGAAETVRFDYRFHRPGRHIVEARLEGTDDLMGDNSLKRVVDVLSTLPVLVVDGSPSARPLEGAADFLDIALAPPPSDEAPNPEAGTRPSREELVTCLVATKVVGGPDVGSVKDLPAYALVVLADVPMLPKAFAEQLARFVREGGGLLIAPGPAVNAAFYNTWADSTGQAVMPGKLVKARSAADKPVHLAVNTFSHPALGKLADEDLSDASSAVLTAYWQIEPPEGDRDVSVGGKLESGEVLLAERKMGKGRVLLWASALHPRATNLPALKCFVPLMHELAYYLAAPTAAVCNIECGSDVTVELRSPPAAAGQTSAGGTGLTGEYFSDDSFSPPALRLTRIDRRIDFDWSVKLPDPSLKREGFVVRWMGRIDPPYTGAYTFYTQSADGVRLWVNGQPLINDWNAGASQERAGQVQLTAGQKAGIRLEYSHLGGHAGMKLQWAGPNLARQTLQTDRLHNDATAAPGRLAKGDHLDVLTPSGVRRQATVVASGDVARVSFSDTQEPGLYRLMLPPSLADRFSSMTPDANGVPFAAADNGGESNLALLSDADLQTARQHLLAGLGDADPAKTLARVDATNELTAAVAGGIPGRELWQYIALVLLGALLAEIVLTRWIAQQRRVHSIRRVDFGGEHVDVKTFRERAKEMLVTAGADVAGKETADIEH